MRNTPLIQACICTWILVAASMSWAAVQSVPDALVLLPKSEHAIVVEKKTQTLYVYEAQDKGIRLITQYPCSTGEVAGPKKKAGDKKTPEGIYFLKDEYEDRYLTPVYGKKAFPSDYPNFLDLRLGKQGSAIWIHGTDRTLKPMDSNGCVAMENQSILELAKIIRLDSTPLIILEQLSTAPAPDLAARRQQAQTLIEQWRQALLSGSYHTYLGFYAEDYLPEISWWESWASAREVAAKKSRPLNIQLDHMGMYAHGDILVALMDMTVTTEKEREYLGKRQLFIRMSGNAPAIIGDLFQKKAAPFQAGDIPLVAAARKLGRDESANEAVVETVTQWLAAWSSKDMTEYADFYASDFVSEGMGKDAWVTRKKQLAKRYNYILVTGSGYKVTKDQDGYEVSFLQKYESSGFSTKGMKQLKMVRVGGAWKIFRENWKGK